MPYLAKRATGFAVGDSPVMQAAGDQITAL